jgi:hypothetical protein
MQNYPIPAPLKGAGPTAGAALRLGTGTVAYMSDLCQVWTFRWQWSIPPALGWAMQLQACVSHITLFAPSNHGNLDEACGLSPNNRREIYS